MDSCVGNKLKVGRGGEGLDLSEILTSKEKGYDYVLTLQKKGDVE